MSASDFLKERNSAIVSNFKELSKDSSISGFRVLNTNPLNNWHTPIHDSKNRSQ